MFGEKQLHKCEFAGYIDGMIPFNLLLRET
jgi:hypothetical protein